MLQQIHAGEWLGSNQATTSVQRERRHPALERFVCAAISSAPLADVLLCNPALALRRYEVGRNLSDFERRLVLSITDAGDIYEFAGRLHAVVRQAHDHEWIPLDERALELPAVEPATDMRAATAATLAR